MTPDHDLEDRWYAEIVASLPYVRRWLTLEERRRIRREVRRILDGLVVRYNTHRRP